jgi:hypothetical protein
VNWLARPGPVPRQSAALRRARLLSTLAGFTHAVGATYAGEPVEVVVAGGLVEVDIVHAGVVVATHAQRLREDQADRAPRARVARRARDANAGLTVTRLANNTGVVTFAARPTRPGAAGRTPPSTAPSSPDQSSCPKTARSSGSTPSATTGPKNSARSPTPKAGRGGRTPQPAMSPSYRNPSVAQAPELDI